MRCGSGIKNSVKGVTVLIDTSAPARIMFIGDLHISDHFQGQHLSYIDNCIEVLTQINEEIMRRKPTHIVLTGDLVGVTERNLRDRNTLLYLITMFNGWNKVTNNNVYSNRGNHDIGSRITDFDFLVGTGVIKHIPHFDAGLYRVHLVDYGDVHRPLDIPSQEELDVFHVAATHTDIRVPGQTSWMDGFHSSDTVNLSDLKTMEGVQLIFAGHIHTPSQIMAKATIGETECSIMYLGNPTRVKKEPNLWNHYFLGWLESDGVSATQDTIIMKLRPHEEIFKAKVVKEEAEEEELNPKLDVDMLMSVLEGFQQYDIRGDMSYKEQIKIHGGNDERAIAIAMQFIEAAEEEFREHG